MTADEGAKAFLLGRVHPAIWVACLGYVVPVVGLEIAGGGGSDGPLVFRLSFLSAAFLLIAGSCVAMWRMNVQKRANPAGPHYAGRLVAVINVAMGLGAFLLFLMVPVGHGPHIPNETSAIGTLRALIVAQEQFRQQALVDLDGDKSGEYGTLGELAGTDPMRGSGNTTATAPFVRKVLGTRYKQTRFSAKSGYLYVLYLPSAASGTVSAVPGTGSAPAVRADADLQETGWIAYAWPIQYGVTANRAFCATHEGEVYACPNTVRKYSGTTSVPAANAAFAPRDGGPPLSGDIGLADFSPGATPASRSYDGELWAPAGN